MPACAQAANALATIRETRAGGQKACATGKKFTIAFRHSISEAAIVKAVRRFADVRAAELGCVTMLHDDTQANNPGLPSIAPRWTEAERIFAANAITIVATINQDAADATAGLKAAEAVLKQYPNLNIIIGINDDSAVGALRAVDSAGIAAEKDVRFGRATGCEIQVVAS